MPTNDTGRALRLADHPALTMAAGMGAVLPVFVVEPEYWALPDTSARQWAFTAEALADLREGLAALGAPLVLRVGDQLVPMPHFGLVLLLPDWQALARRLEATGMDFVLKPQLRFEGQPGEQWTMFFCDPFGNPIEVKGFASLDRLYAS